MEKQEVLSRLQKYTKIEGTCWRFTGARVDDYGVLRVDNNTYKVNRLSAWIFHDLNLDNSSILALHKPECPNKDCWNPEHIYKGNHSNNLYDRVKTGTFKNKYTDATHCIHGHEFTPENTYIPKDGRRRCSKCRDINRQKHKEKQPKLVITSKINKTTKG